MPRCILYGPGSNLADLYRGSYGNKPEGRVSERKMLSKAQWEELKPFIRDLYWEQRATLKVLAQYVFKHYGFTPTCVFYYLLSPNRKLLSWTHSKKQLTRRISSWGLGKNIKRTERKTIIEGIRLELEPKAASFETRELKGRRLDKAKLKRWMREESATPVGSEHETTRVEKPCSMSIIGHLR
jgi:hypothetical protein